jgi:hypothetical protein
MNTKLPTYSRVDGSEVEVHGLALKRNGVTDSFATVLSGCFTTNSEAGFVEMFALDRSARRCY